jgi:hypothetical protein
MTHDAFVSYASEDKSAADTICAGLEARGISCWIAPRDVLPGQDETASILTAIDTSAIVVLCLSSAANASKLVTQQAARAFNKHVPIVPLRIEEVEPSDALTLFLGPQEPFDAFAPPLEAHLGAFAELLGSFLEAGATPATGVKPLSRPPYAPVPYAPRERRGGAPSHAGRRVAVFAVFIIVAVIFFAALFTSIPQFQPQLISVLSKAKRAVLSLLPSAQSSPSPEPSPTPTPTATTPDYSDFFDKAFENSYSTVTTPFTKSTNARGNDVYTGRTKNLAAGYEMMTAVELTKSQDEAKQLYDQVVAQKQSEGFVLNPDWIAQMKARSPSLVGDWVGQQASTGLQCSIQYYDENNVASWLLITEVQS